MSNKCLKKLWFIHELTAHYTSKTAKKLQKGDYPPAHRLSVNVLLSNSVGWRYATSVQN